MNYRISLLIPKSSITTEVNKTGSWRFLKPIYDEKTAPCSVACPASEDIPLIQMLTNQGYFKEAWETILKENPFPGICGRVCFHPCENNCNRKIFDEAVNIRAVERFLSDTAARYGLTPALDIVRHNGQKIAIIGSGPAGLAASYFFTILGYRCTVFERLSKPGGLLRWGIPEYRLPEYVLDRELDFIKSLGVEFRLSSTITRENLSDIASDYHGVFIATGTWNTRKGHFEGAEYCEDGLRFLTETRSGKDQSFEGTALVIGGGNTAIDVARSVLRLGGNPVIVYRRRREDMPAFREEIEAADEEGVEFMFQYIPVKVSPSDSGQFDVLLKETIINGTDENGTDENGRATFSVGLKEKHLTCNRVFLATGFEPDSSWFPYDEAYQWFNSAVFINNSKNCKWILGGDLTTSSKTVTYAISSGKEAAIVFDIINNYGKDSLREKLEECKVGNGRFLSMEIYKGGSRRDRNSRVVEYEDINTDYFAMSPRLAVPRLLPDERIVSFKEIELHISGSIAIREAGRCFNCGICNDCDNCRLFCPDVSVRKNEGERYIDYDYCKGCGVCVVECPRCAMSLIEESLE